MVSPRRPDDLMMKHTDLMHFSSTLCTFNKSGNKKPKISTSNIPRFLKIKGRKINKYTENLGTTYSSGSSVSFFLLENCSLFIVLRREEGRNEKKRYRKMSTVTTGLSQGTNPIL